MKDLRTKKDDELSAKEKIIFLGARRISDEALISIEIRINRFLKKNPEAQEMEQVHLTTFLGNICTNIIGKMLLTTKSLVDKHYDSCDVSLNDLFEEVFHGVRMKITQNGQRVIEAPKENNPFAHVRPPESNDVRN